MAKLKTSVNYQANQILVVKFHLLGFLYTFYQRAKLSKKHLFLIECFY